MKIKTKGYYITKQINVETDDIQYYGIFDKQAAFEFEDYLEYQLIEKNIEPNITTILNAEFTIFEKEKISINSKKINPKKYSIKGNYLLFQTDEFEIELVKGQNGDFANSLNWFLKNIHLYQGFIGENKILVNDNIIEFSENSEIENALKNITNIKKDKIEYLIKNYIKTEKDISKKHDENIFNIFKLELLRREGVTFEYISLSDKNILNSLKYSLMIYGDNVPINPKNRSNIISASDSLNYIKNIGFELRKLYPKASIWIYSNTEGKILMDIKKD